MGFSTRGGLQGCGYRSLSQLLFRAPDAGQAFILILFLAFCYLLRLFIPLHFLKYYGFNDQKPLRPAEFSGILFLTKNNFIGFRDPRTLEDILMSPLILQTRNLELREGQ